MKKTQLIPISIIAVFCFFIIFILQFVFRSMDNDTHLVSENYYQDELNYQTHIDKLNRSKSIQNETIFTSQGDTLTIQFPSLLSTAKGSIEFYNPVNPLLDQMLNITIEDNKPITISTKNLPRGSWTLKVNLLKNKTEYYVEKQLTL